MKTRRKEVRRKLVETAHGMWIRNDLWAAVEDFAKEKGISKKRVVNEALFDFLLKEGLEIKTGMPTEYKDTDWYPDKNMTMRKDEAKTYIKEE